MLSWDTTIFNCFFINPVLHSPILQYRVWHHRRSWLFHLASLQWRNNGREGFSNHGRLDCLLNRLSRRRLKKHQSSASLDFVNSQFKFAVRMSSADESLVINIFGSRICTAPVLKTLNSLWPSHAICWLMMNGVSWHSSRCSFARCIPDVAP